MNRDLQAMSRKGYDVLIVGCGVYGAFAAREAALRGLSVAVIDKKDFCGATSANSLKIIHGGLRYLQQFDLARVLESAAERRNLLRMAPHLVHPLPCLMPTRGMGLRSKPALFLGLLANDLLTWTRNRGMDREQRIPPGRIVSRDALRRLVPGLDDKRFNGAAVWHDAIAHNTERLVVDVVKAAVRAGADAANYTEMIRFVKDGNKVTGAVVQDAFSGQSFTIQAGLVVNNTGPWVNETLAKLDVPVSLPVSGLVLEMNLLLNKQIVGSHAVGLSSYRKTDAKERLLFFVPWQGRTLVGTYCRLFTGRVDDRTVTEQDLNGFIADINSAFPSAQVGLQDIAWVYSGLLPIEKGSEAWAEPEPCRHYTLVDHAAVDGVEGLFSVLGVKYTTARGVAEKTVDQILAKMGKADALPTGTAGIPLPGGDRPDFARFQAEARNTVPAGLEALLRPISHSCPVIGAEVLHAIREEMAQTLSDVVFRRTELGALGLPDEPTLRACAVLMAPEQKWDPSRIEAEIAGIKQELLKPPR